MLYNDGDKFGLVYYQGNPVGEIWKNGRCIYPAEPIAILDNYFIDKFFDVATSVTPSTITAIHQSNTYPSNSMLVVDVSDSQNSSCPIYMWEYNSVLYWYSIAKRIYANNRLTFLYSKAGSQFGANCIDISGLRNWDTSLTTNFYYTFSGFSNLVDISPIRNWDISHADTVNLMFNECTLLEDISILYKLDWSNIGIKYQSECFSQVFARTSVKCVDFCNMPFGNPIRSRVLFIQCSDLEICDISDNFSALASEFQYCTNLSTLIVRLGEVSLDSAAFTGATTMLSSNGKVYAPQQYLSWYTTNWSYLWQYGCQLLPLEGSQYEHPGSVSALYP